MKKVIVWCAVLFALGLLAGGIINSNAAPSIGEHRELARQVRGLRGGWANLSRVEKALLIAVYKIAKDRWPSLTPQTYLEQVRDIARDDVPVWDATLTP